MNHEYLLEYSALAKKQLAEWRKTYFGARKPIDKLPAEHMIRVYAIISSHVVAEADEEMLRSGIAELREIMSTGLDARAFMTAQSAIDTIHDILGDEEIDTGLVPRTLEEAVHFLAGAIEPDTVAKLRADIVEGRGQAVRESFRLGMSVRNTLRAAGFTEMTLGIANLDDAWYSLLERAVLGLETERAIREKASFAASAARMVAANSTVEFVERYPGLKAVANEDWDAFVLTGCHWALRMYLTISGLPIKTQNVASSTLADAFMAHIPYIEETTAVLTTYVERAVSQSSPLNEEDAFQLTVVLVGAWCLAQMQDIVPSDVDQAAAQHLGALMVVGWRDWWTRETGS